uniref:Uncharacterized protein n=1 Tax=Octopus bimaculoides TaxID=37653 RepID=A0A0L8G1V1_OCTBM
MLQTEIMIYFYDILMQYINNSVFDHHLSQLFQRHSSGSSSQTFFIALSSSSTNEHCLPSLYTTFVRYSL